MDRRLWVLAAGSLAMGRGSIAVAGVLVGIAEGLKVDAAAAGRLVAAFALASWCRRRVLLLGLVVFTLGAVGSALAPSYGWMLLARIVAGIGVAIFTPNATVVAASLVAPEQRGRAVAVVFGGFTLASAVAVPRATALEAVAGWRGALGFTAVLGALALAAVAARLRGRIDAPPARAEQWLAALRDRSALGLLTVTATAMAGTFVVFAFIAPFLLAHPLPAALGLALLMFWIGLAGSLGTWVAGRVVDRFGTDRVVVATLLSALAGLLLMGLAGQHIAALLLGLALWGTGAFGTNAAQQARLVGHAPALSGALLPANAAVLSARHALGGAVGGMWLAQQGAAEVGTGAALVSLPLVGAVALALLLSYAVSAKPAVLAGLRPTWLRAGAPLVASLAVVALWAGVAVRADEATAATNAAQRNIGELSTEAQLLAIVKAPVQR